MKKALTILTVALAIGLTAVADAEAKRLGGARNSGMQKQQSSQPATTPAAQPNAPGAPAQAAPAAATTAAAAAPAAAAKRSWAGPLTALAAGLGLAALASYFGFGEALANMMLIALVVMAVLAAIAFVMRKRAAPGPAAAMAGMGGSSGASDSSAPRGVRIGAALGAASASRAQPGAIPADFDVAAFVRNAKAQFTALQAANDAGDLTRLRDYLSPEMFEMARQELALRGTATQRTETFGLEAQVVEVSEDADRYVVSVRFTGSTRDQQGAVPDDLDELWHLTKPRTGAGGWVVAGIQQVSASH